MDTTQTRVSHRVELQKLNQRRQERNRNLFLAGFFFAVALALTFLLLTGCTDETYVSVTDPCCPDICNQVHTCDASKGCTDDCASDDNLKTFVWVCKDGVQKKIYEFNLDKYLRQGWTKGKCKGTPPGDDDDDDSSDKVCICHIPPGNPENAHTICISPNAVDAHIRNHGDYLGECVD
jgi:hypothetical protein